MASTSSVTFAGNVNPKKRTHAEVEEDPTEQEVAAMSRSERKRHREKKRRSDVNKGFDELMALLLEIDPEVRADAEERASKGQCKRSLGAHEDNVLSRVDLIATAVRVLRRVHTENEKHKKMIDEFLKNKGASESQLPRPSTAGSSLASGAAGGLSELNPYASSALDRASLLGLSSGATPSAVALGLSEATTAAQLRAKANLMGNLPSASGASALGDYTTADLLALAGRNQAAAAQAAAAQASARDAALFSQLNANKQALQRNLLVQNMLSNSGAVSHPLDSILGLGSAADQPSQQASPFSLAEGLYGALGGGRGPVGGLSKQKEEELRRLRAAGHSL